MKPSSGSAVAIDVHHLCGGVSVISYFPSPGSPSAIDPYDSYFRVRLVCVLLDTCGEYFDFGSSKKKLDNFIVFFQVSAECVYYTITEGEYLVGRAPCGESSVYWLCLTDH